MSHLLTVASSFGIQGYELLEPSLGWTLLSRDALRRAETQLRNDIQGVRDEVGFLALHQAYADRFFPGTSVQHTRLRYVLFVPWIYQSLIEQGVRERISDAVTEAEINLVGQLRQTGESGIIGTDNYPCCLPQPLGLFRASTRHSVRAPT